MRLVTRYMETTVIQSSPSSAVLFSGGLDSAVLWGWCLLLLALATLGKFGGGYWAARWSNLNHHESKVIAIMMNTRGLMELIVINTGFDLGVISQNVFTMLVLMAIVSTVITTPGLRVWLPKSGIPIPAKSQDTV